ncbi:MAG: TAXI family TRAP transporter solute-binding subunit [Pseudomonadota bacterium]
MQLNSRGIAWVVAVVTAACFSGPAAAQDEQPYLTITTGSPSGTYYRFAREIAEMLPSTMRLDIAESEGSVQNLRRLIGYEGQSEQKYYQLAMVQADVLDQLRNRAKGDEVLETIVGRIKVVMPLYNEEIHAFSQASMGLNSIEDLLDDSILVNAGGEKSGTNLTARWLFEQIGETERTFDWANVPDEAGLPNIGNGYDVLFSVAGAPSNLGRSIEPNQDVTLVPIEVPALYDLENSPYRPAILTRDVYPWLQDDVKTMAVTALLVAFDYDENNPYCELIERLTLAILDGLAFRQEPGGGHPKWRDVDKVNAQNRSDLYACAERALNAR